MKKLLSLLLTFFLLNFISFSAPHFSKPVFSESVELVTPNSQYLNFSALLGKDDKGKKLIYFPGWGRIFLNENKDGFVDVNNNMEITKLKNGALLVTANVTMFDMNYMNKNYKKGEFFHSLYGYLHSHIFVYPEKNIVKIGDEEFSVDKSVNDFDGSILFTEKNGKFTILFPKSISSKEAPMPDLAEFKFKTILTKKKMTSHLFFVFLISYHSI